MILSWICCQDRKFLATRPEARSRSPLRLFPAELWALCPRDFHWPPTQPVYFLPGFVDQNSDPCRQGMRQNYFLMQLELRVRHGVSGSQAGNFKIHSGDSYGLDMIEGRISFRSRFEKPHESNVCWTMGSSWNRMPWCWAIDFLNDHMVPRSILANMVRCRLQQAGSEADRVHSNATNKNFVVLRFIVFFQGLGSIWSICRTYPVAHHPAHPASGAAGPLAHLTLPTQGAVLRFLGRSLVQRNIEHSLLGTIYGAWSNIGVAIGNLPYLDLLVMTLSWQASQEHFRHSAVFWLFQARGTSSSGKKTHKNCLPLLLAVKVGSG